MVFWFRILVVWMVLLGRILKGILLLYWGKSEKVIFLFLFLFVVISNLIEECFGVFFWIVNLKFWFWNFGLLLLIFVILMMMLVVFVLVGEFLFIVNIFSVINEVFLWLSLNCVEIRLDFGLIRKLYLEDWSL